MVSEITSYLTVCSTVEANNKENSKDLHYCLLVLGMLQQLVVSQITSLTIVYSIIDSGTDERKHKSSASLAFVRGIHQWPVNSPHKGPAMRKMFPIDDAIMKQWSLCPDFISHYKNLHDICIYSVMYKITTPPLTH